MSGANEALVTTGEPAVQRRSSGTRAGRIFPRFAAAISLLTGFLLWELLSRTGLINPIFLPPLSLCLQDLWYLVSTGILWEHLWVSTQEFAVGMAIAGVSGIVIGFATGISRVMDLALTPWLAWFYAVPRVALVPILLVWFGLGVESKIAIVTLLAFFPIAINSAAGARTVDRRLLEMAAAFSVPRSLLFRAVIIPSAVPYVLTGIRLGIGTGLIGVVVGELFASRAGLGFLLVQAGYTFNAPRIFAMVFVLSGIGVGLTLATSALERRFDAWRG